MKILSCGAGMQSSALHLMSCENALAKKRGKQPVWPQVPIEQICFLRKENTDRRPPKKGVDLWAT